MKRIPALLLFCMVLLFIQSCGSTKIYQHNVDCTKINSTEMFKSITTLVIKENMTVKHYDEKIGYLQAETLPQYNAWMGGETWYQWNFQNNNGKIIAYAKIFVQLKNAFGATTAASEAFCGDNTHKDYLWYWNVRHGLESICQDKFIIITTEKK